MFCLLISGSLAHADIITFDGQGFVNVSSIPFSYGDIAGQVDVTYSSNLKAYVTGYPTTVAVPINSGPLNPGVIKLTALSGGTITLNSFTLINYSGSGAASQTVDTGAMHIDNASQAYSNFAPISFSIGQSRTFTAADFGTITVTSGTLAIFFPDVNGTGDIGIDDINYTYTAAASVPEPASLTLVGIGLGLFAMRRLTAKNAS